MQPYSIVTMHKRAEYSNILVSLDTLTIGRQQRWLEFQPPPHTREQAAAVKRVKRLIRLSKDEENE